MLSGRDPDPHGFAFIFLPRYGFKERIQIQVGGIWRKNLFFLSSGSVSTFKKLLDPDLHWEKQLIQIHSPAFRSKNCWLLQYYYIRCGYTSFTVVTETYCMLSRCHCRETKQLILVSLCFLLRKLLILIRNLLCWIIDILIRIRGTMKNSRSFALMILLIRPIHMLAIKRKNKNVENKEDLSLG